ncbi:MAG: RNA methyltransferase [Actinomycetota bacterium]
MEATSLGASNPRLRRLRKLTAKSRARSDEGVFVIDGPRLVGDAITAGVAVREIYGDEAELGALLRDRSIGDDTEVFRVDPEVLTSVLDPVSPRPLAAVAAMPSAGVASVLAASGPILVAVELGDPGNLGTVLRTAEAAGMVGVVVAGRSVDRFAPKVVRASAGSLFRLPVAEADDPAALIDDLRKAGHPSVATVVDAGASAHDRADLTEAAILLGNEPHGLAPEIVAAADTAITIPMAPGVESLNVAAAAAVLCFEAARQRRAVAGGAVGAADEKYVGHPPQQGRR